MSTRAQVAVVQPEGRVYLYQHSDGYELENEVRGALRRGRDRWTDDSYLTRIIFCEMLQGNVEGTTGYGIDLVEHGDIEFLVVVDPAEQTVEVNGAGKVSFEEFCAG